MLTEAVRVLAQVVKILVAATVLIESVRVLVEAVIVFEALMMLGQAVKVLVCRGCWRASEGHESTCGGRERACEGCESTCPGHLVLVRAVRMLTEVVKMTVEAVVASV